MNSPQNAGNADPDLRALLPEAALNPNLPPGQTPRKGPTFTEDLHRSDGTD
jgi:hypothetical protein